MVAEKFENKIETWTTLKKVSECWSNEKLKTWEQQLLLNSFCKGYSFDTQKMIGEEIKRLQRDRDRARKLLIQVFDEICTANNYDKIHANFTRYLKYAKQTDKR